MSKNINFIEAPREAFHLGLNEQSSLLGGFNCIGTFKEGGVLGSDICSPSYDSGVCGGSDDYCRRYSSCSFHLG